MTWVFSLDARANPDTSAFAGEFSRLSNPCEATAENEGDHQPCRNLCPSLLGILVPYHGGNIVLRRQPSRPWAISSSVNRWGTGPWQFAENTSRKQFVRLLGLTRTISPALRRSRRSMLALHSFRSSATLAFQGRRDRHA